MSRAFLFCDPTNVGEPGCECTRADTDVRERPLGVGGPIPPPYRGECLLYPPYKGRWSRHPPY